ncbi:TonB-dependent receptor plug domain-containing protein [Azospirillum griseum]|nr:TonB-dependent receptor [Azospirillum griseum]
MPSHRPRATDRLRAILRPGTATTAAVALLLGGIAAPLSSAGAQAIDHGALEALFGEPVTTSATGKPQRVSEAPVTMDIVTADDIRRAAATDIPGILRQLAGIDVWEWGRGASDVGVRGYNQPYSPRLLVLINGRQVYLDHYGMTAWSTLPVQLAEIRQIEVVKGPNTALFGFNAVSGVINIITFNPLYDTVSNATARVGTPGYAELSAVRSVKLGDRIGLRLSAGGTSADAFDKRVRADDRQILTKPQRRAFNADGLMQVNDHSQLGVELSYSTARQNEFFPQWEMNIADYRTLSAKATYALDSDLGQVEASLYHNMLKVDVDSASFPMLNVTNGVTVARVQDLFKIGTDHSVRLAGEYRHNAMDNVAISGGNTSYSVWSASGMWDWAITDQLALTNALRLDHLRLDRKGATTVYGEQAYDRTMTKPSFNTGLVFKATPQDTVRLSAARGLQIPTLIEYGYSESRVVGIDPRSGRPIPGAFSGNPNLKPTTVMNYELSYDRTLPSIDAVGRVSLFFQTSDNIKALPGYTPTRLRGGVLPEFTFTNVGKSQAWGLEAGLKGKIGGDWRWGLNYTFERIRDRLTVNTTAITNSTEFGRETPHHKLNASIGFTAGDWEGDLYARYSTSYDMLRRSDNARQTVYDRVKVPSYVTLDTRLGYKLTDATTVALQGTAITQTAYRQTSGPAVERQVFLTLSTRF